MGAAAEDKVEPTLKTPLMSDVDRPLSKNVHRKMKRYFVKDEGQGQKMRKLVCVVRC